MARRFSKKSFKFKTGIRKVNVPNLSGLSRSQAKTALESVGLTWSETSSTMQNINLDNTIENQGVASGTTVNIGQSISFSYYVYVAPPPPPPPADPPSTPPADPPQDSSISSLSPSNGAAAGGYTVTVNGSFPSNVTNIGFSHQGANVSSFTRVSASQYTFTMVSGTAGTTTTVYVYNGRIPVMTSTFTYNSVVDPPSGPPQGPPQGPPSTPPEAPPVTETSRTVGTCISDVYCPQGGERLDTVYYSNGTSSEQYVCCSYTAPPSGPPQGPPSTPPADPPSTPPADPPATPPADPPAGPPADPPATPPADPPIFDGNFYGKSVNVSTLVRTPSGLVRADNLNVGDVLLSADLDGFPYNPGEGVTEEALAWTSENPNINFVNTTIVGIRRRIGDKAIIINGDIFSQYHWILVKRDNVVKFVLSENIVENSDYIFDADTNTWEIVDLFEAIEVNHETISIDCEPYDMFFTEKMLTHDSFSI